MKNTVFFILIFFATSAFAAETAAFDLFFLGNKVGEIVATHEKRTDGSDYYHMVTKAHAKVLWIVHDQLSTYDVVYKDGKLLSSKQWSHDNEDTTSCNVVRSPNGIVATLREGKKLSYTEIPVFSIVKLYFHEPKGLDHFFQETEGVFVKFTMAENGSYEFKSRNGDRSIYHYINGVLDNTEFHTSIVSVKVKRRK